MELVLEGVIKRGNSFRRRHVREPLCEIPSGTDVFNDEFGCCNWVFGCRTFSSFNGSAWSPRTRLTCSLSQPASSSSSTEEVEVGSPASSVE